MVAVSRPAPVLRRREDRQRGWEAHHLEQHADELRRLGPEAQHLEPLAREKVGDRRRVDRPDETGPAREPRDLIEELDHGNVVSGKVDASRVEPGAVRELFERNGNGVGWYDGDAAEWWCGQRNPRGQRFRDRARRGEHRRQGIVGIGLAGVGPADDHAAAIDPPRGATPPNKRLRVTQGSDGAVKRLTGVVGGCESGAEEVNVLGADRRRDVERRPRARRGEVGASVRRRRTRQMEDVAHVAPHTSEIARCDTARRLLLVEAGVHYAVPVLGR